MTDQSVIALGAHILDTLVRPVEAIPEGQGGQLVEQIKVAVGGPAAGTALVLAKLGATVRSAGAVGVDPVGDLLVALLQRDGVGTDMLLRRNEIQTSATVLPIRADGSRPAFHVIGANGTYGPDDLPLDEIARADHLHVGGPEFLGPDLVVKVLAHARQSGVTTSLDSVAPENPAVFDYLAPVFPLVDHLLINDEQAIGWTGADHVEDACRRFIAAGVGTAAITTGSDGAVVLSHTDTLPRHVPAFAVEALDTTGCGDAFSAGYVRGLGLGRPPPDAAVLGCATAAQVAGGLGTDFGAFDLAAVESFAAEAPRYRRR